ncbi:MAG: GTP cyclohydrolase I FolE [Alicyclobacillus sp. RIFOXYA1_FULL_53_8]|nr:MAG: GTP cyclohydrolase I FolE [Alicyclobacillus sp. RIFOXYA1_FULL_53_8]
MSYAWRIGVTTDMSDELIDEMTVRFDVEKIQQAVRMILEAIGEDLTRDGLRETPERVARMFQEIFTGLHTDAAAVLSAQFHTSHDELVFVKDIPFFSMCEHHLLPFFGKAHIAYIPRNGIVAGLSKLARLVDATAKRPQVQERMTDEIAQVLESALNVQGVMVVVQAEHLCMNMRGVKKPGSTTLTLATKGTFSAEPSLRQEVLQLIQLS